jgi:hypothetical protein
MPSDDIIPQKILVFVNLWAQGKILELNESLIRREVSESPPFAQLGSS